MFTTLNNWKPRQPYSLTSHWRKLIFQHAQETYIRANLKCYPIMVENNFLLNYNSIIPFKMPISLHTACIILLLKHWFFLSRNTNIFSSQKTKIYIRNSTGISS